jgi:hypothetical protein
MADAYVDKGDYALAVKQFGKVVKKAPEHLPALIGLATFLEKLGKKPEEVARAYVDAAAVADRLGDTDFAAKLFDRGVKAARSIASEDARVKVFDDFKKIASTDALAALLNFQAGQVDVARQFAGGGEGLQKLLEEKLEAGVIGVTDDVAAVLGPEHDLVVNGAKETPPAAAPPAGGGVLKGGLNSGGGGQRFGAKQVAQEPGGADDGLSRLAEGANTYKAGDRVDGGTGPNVF